MATLILRTAASGPTAGETTKGAPLTNAEVDGNFKSLNANKLEKDGSISMTGKLLLAAASVAGSLNIPSGTAATPVSGDLWNDGGILSFRNGSTTEKILTTENLDGTVDQIAVTVSGPTVTLATPQNIGTASNVKFGSLLIGSATTPVSGQVKASGDVIAFASSDSKLKANVEPISNALNKVLQLNGVMFDWNDVAKEVYNFEGKDTGVIAQEVAQVLPEVVTTRDDGFMAVKYEKMIGLLIEAIKELNGKVENCTCNK